MDLSWYLRRLKGMTPGEMARRLRDELTKQSMRLQRSRVGAPGGVRSVTGPAPLPSGQISMDDEMAGAIIVEAEQILDGRWRTLGVDRADMCPAPDWFLDPQTGIRAPSSRYTFGINPRDPREVGNIKNVWEVSRHHHVTILAAAYWLSGREEFATGASRHLTSWWEQNRFLEGVHWRSGIELGIRLISWTWVRRLLDGWDGARGVFEGNPVFHTQLYQHLYYLARLPSHGSSANNHLVAEAAGRFVACCAFPWFPESERWLEDSSAVLQREAGAQTFSSGINRELATGYHGFVLELLITAAVEGEASGYSLGSDVWEQIQLMMDALAGIVDAQGSAPRQGDDDEGCALMLGPGSGGRWGALLATGDRLFGRRAWWPAISRVDARTALWTSLIEVPIVVGSRPDRRPSVFADAGMVILRDFMPSPREIWCRCDGGPHGFLSIASHAHADALSVEVRLGGTEILADPGTYGYQTEPQWRTYFRSTSGHNTLELAGVDQSVAGGPFNWVEHAQGSTVSLAGVDDGTAAEWIGEHDGYSRLEPPATHRRRVVLDRESRHLMIEDQIVCEGSHPCRLAFHLGPEIECRLAGATASLEWTSPEGLRRASITLPESLVWEQVRGRSDPPAGWYSSGLGVKVPAVSLFGSGELDGSSLLVTKLDFSDDSGTDRRAPMEPEEQTTDRGMT